MSTTLINSICNNDVAAVKKALSRGACVNAESSYYKETAMMYAIQQGNMECVALLIEYGADLSRRNSFGTTCLMTCSIPCTNLIACLRLLIRGGADINARDDVGNTPLLWAICSNRILYVQALINAGADMDLRNDNGADAMNASRGEIYELIVAQYRIRAVKVLTTTIHVPVCGGWLKRHILPLPTAGGHIVLHEAIASYAYA